MARWRGIIAAAGLLAVSGGQGAAEMLPDDLAVPDRIQTVQAGRTCKSVGSCREAVILWCSGYRRADGDGDGIPCENVCPDRRTVDAIRKQIGC